MYRPDREGARQGLRMRLRRLTSAYINMAEWQTLHESLPRQLLPVEPEAVRKEKCLAKNRRRAQVSERDGEGESVREREHFLS